MLKTTNKIVCGDSYQTLKRLQPDFVDLIYIDPPFFANRVFEVEKKSGKTISFDDTWSNDIRNYLSYMKKTFIECKRVLKNTGSIYVHCDWHASHYLKITLDEIFGYQNFQNEIVWRRHNSHNDTKQGSKHLGRVHDTILFYSKSKDCTWNPIYQPYPDDYVKKFYRHIEPETGRRYAYGDLSGPGGHSKGNPRYEFLGVTRYWRFSKTNMKKLYDEGKIIQTKPGNVPVMKRYLDDMPGLMLQDVWDDVKSVQVTKTESCDYPTQKPLRLLERIIELSSNPNGVVLDPMCGSGTALIAAKRLGRKFIGIDNNPDATKICKKRLTATNPTAKLEKTIPSR